jgi:SAM-dependent methyltransferase
MLGPILDETKKMARNPRRLREVFRLRRWRQFFGILFFHARTGDRWKTPAEGEKFKQREYSSYLQYLEHQQSKFQHLDLADYDRNYRRILAGRLQKLPALKKGASVLCLGARQGTEVKAFLDLGCFAVGIDLNPGVGNEFVMHGDFHALQFPAGSVDVVFTNSFDHAFDPKKMIGEVNRILKPDGVFIVEASRGESEAVAPDHYASFWWQRVDDLVALLEEQGFHVLQRSSFEQPWPGEQICLGKRARA